MFFFLSPSLLLIAAAVIPAIVLLSYIYKKDRTEKEPKELLTNLIVLGILSTSVAAALERLGAFFLDRSTLSAAAYNAVMYFGIVAPAEEGSKYVLLKKRTWNATAFDCQFDGVVYAVFVSLGFALWENVGYVLSYGFGNALVRAVTAVPGHACFGVFMGVGYGAAKRFDFRGEGGKSAVCRLLAFVLPCLLHGAYDFIASMQSDRLVVIFVAFIAVLFFIAYRLVKHCSEHDRKVWE